jgi:hypothetical protein
VILASRDGRNNYFFETVPIIPVPKIITVTNNGYKITVCSTTWYDTYSVEVPGFPLLQ